jgi:hypothetical protein
VVLVLDEEGFSSAVEDQGFRPFLKEEWMRWTVCWILPRGDDLGVEQ